jgi:hypothetical protein
VLDLIHFTVVYAYLARAILRFNLFVIMSDFKTINLHAVDAVLTVIYFCAVCNDTKSTISRCLMSSNGTVFKHSCGSCHDRMSLIPGIPC